MYRLPIYEGMKSSLALTGDRACSRGAKYFPHMAAHAPAVCRYVTMNPRFWTSDRGGQ